MFYTGIPNRRGPSGKSSHHSNDKSGDSCDDRERLKYTAKKTLKQVRKKELSANWY